MAAKKISNVSLSEIVRRVPPSQMINFKEFRDKTSDYESRVRKFPETLPLIDWSYYRRNVREEFTKMVDDFERKYQELNEIFDKRIELDTSKYYTEVEKIREDVKRDVDAFIAESNERIKAYENEIGRIRALKPYAQMSVEEFCETCPDEAVNYPHGGKPSFWPHLPEDQTPGPAGYPESKEETPSSTDGSSEPTKPTAEEVNTQEGLKEAMDNAKATREAAIMSKGPARSTRSLPAIRRRTPKDTDNDEKQ